MGRHCEPYRSFFVIVVAAFLHAGFAPSTAAGSEPDAKTIAAGERLVGLLDCNTCHTPKVMTPRGPQPDSSRLLSGHRADEKLPSVPEGVIGPAGWGGVFNAHLTAWAGPWGVSFGANLTPDAETGIGNWTEEMFVEAMRTGTHLGEGRPFLPPMPTYAALTDAELHAMFVYLGSIEPVRNRVPKALPPSPPNAKK